MAQLLSLFFWRAILAEFLGTAVYVAVVLGVALSWDPNNGNDQLKIAICFGLTLAVISYTFGPSSGGHVNPAITISCAINKRISFLKAVGYLIVQCGGAVTGTAIIHALTPEKRRDNLGILSLQNNTTYLQGFGMEVILGFMISFVYLSGTDPERNDSSFGPGFAYGSANIAGHLIALPYTSCGMNPARALGPAILKNHWPSYHWIYWAGPIAGAVVAGILYALIFSVPEDSFTASADFKNTNDYIIERPAGLDAEKYGGTTNGAFGNTSV